jgi:hypothetical protein
MYNLLTADDGRHVAKAAEPATKVDQPIQVASFEC